MIDKIIALISRILKFIFRPKVLWSLLNVDLILIILLPFSHDFNPNNGQWEDTYVYDFEDELSLFFFGSLIVSCILVQIIKPSDARALLKFMAITLAGFGCLLSFFSVTMIAQDSIPHLGVLLLGTAFPLLIVLYCVEWYAKQIKPLPNKRYKLRKATREG